MHAQTTHLFALPDRLAAKADPALTAGDERHLAAVADRLAHAVAELAARLDAERRAPAGGGRRAVDRDAEVRRLTARLRTLRRFGPDLCIGRMVLAGDPTPVYVGRLGLTDDAGDRLLVDWRSPAAEPFFAATHAHPMGLAARRRYRWAGGRVTDYWDEVFAPGAAAGHAALDDHSAFVAGLGESRSGRMRDVLGTIQADQDAVIRAGSAGTLVVDGGPGTGKTVVALHRSAYLLYADPRLGHRRGGLLFVGPHEPYLAYVADVLPGLGEEGVLTCTLADLVAEGATAPPEADPVVARLKSSGAMVDAVEAAVAFYEEPPATALTVRTGEADVRVRPADWAEAFAAVEPGTPHNEAREQVRDALLAGLAARYADDAPEPVLRRSLAADAELRATLHRAWPLLDPADVVADLWSVPAYLRRCAPWLTRDEARALHRADPRAWTAADLPLLDAARRRLGDPAAAHRQRRHDAAVAVERARRAAVVDELVAAHTYDDGEGVLASLRQLDLQDALVDGAALPRTDPDRLAGPFAHVVVDEAQELTDAQWRMLLARCPSRSFTVVGDRAQARHGFAGSWAERLARAGLDRVRVAGLRVNYRTPQEVMAEAEPVVRAVLPDANVPVSVRRTGVPVVHGARAELDAVVDGWLAAHADGTACVVAAGDPGGAGAWRGSPRARWLTPELAKGLEFDLVVLVDPAAFGAGVAGAVDRYVAMTRTTRQLVVLGAGAGDVPA